MRFPLLLTMCHRLLGVGVIVSDGVARREIQVVTGDVGGETLVRSHARVGLEQAKFKKRSAVCGVVASSSVLQTVQEARLVHPEVIANPGKGINAASVIRSTNALQLYCRPE